MKTMFDKYDEQTLDTILSRSELELEYDELYESVTDETMSINESRKRTYGIKSYLIKKQKMTETNAQEELQKLADKETFEIKNDNSHVLTKFVMACEEELKSPDRIMEVLGYDPLSWELTSSKHSRWNVSAGAMENKMLYSLRATVKPRKIQLEGEKVQKLFYNLKLNMKDIESYDYRKSGEYVLEIPMMDVHFNKLSDERIVGVKSNSETIKTEFLAVVRYFLSKADNMNIERIIFPIGQDYFNSEANGSTTGGTPQDNDLPKDLMFERGTDLLFQAIELCRAVAPVLVQYVPGNHDSNIGYYSASSLKRGYEMASISGVEFDITPKRKYFEFGKCLIGYTHGNKEKIRVEKENIMQVEMREAWGRTKFHEWHMGHEHHEQVLERGGIKYRKINSITANDNWHYESGYVGALRMAQAFLWHKDFGLLDIYNCPIINS